MKLINADVLKDFTYINKGNFNTVESIREWIDNAPAVADRTKEVLSLQNTIAKLVEGIDENARQQGEWIIVKDKKWGDNVKCPFCEKELAGTDLNFCCKCGARLTGSEKMNRGAE